MNPSLDDADGSAYYKWLKSEGLDLADRNAWHDGYVQTIVEAIGEWPGPPARLLDLGSACGAQLGAFKDLAAFDSVVGVERSRHMVELGRQKFKLTTDELRVGDVCELPIDRSSVSVIHASNVFEHLTPEMAERAIREAYRVLRAWGSLVAISPAVKTAADIERHKSDPTHRTLVPPWWWDERFAEVGFVFDSLAIERMARSKIESAGGLNYFQSHAEWSIWTLRKPG